MIRTGILLLVLPGLLLIVSCSQEPGANPANPDSGTVFTGGGFDQYGYNSTAQRFKGTVDGADWILDGAYYGNPRHANDNLTMRWNDEWIRGVAESWANPPYDAKCSYSWKSDKESIILTWWMYDIIWVGEDLQASPRWKSGGFPIWGEFEVIFKGRTVANIDFWETQVLPEGTVCPSP